VHKYYAPDVGLVFIEEIKEKRSGSSRLKYCILATPQKKILQQPKRSAGKLQAWLRLLAQFSRKRTAFPGKIAFNNRKNLEFYFSRKQRIHKPGDRIRYLRIGVAVY